MSWSYGAIYEKGMILTEDDFKKILKMSKVLKKDFELTNDDIDEMYGGDLMDLVFNIDMYSIYATVCDIYTLKGFNSMNEGDYDLRKTIEEENIYVIWLKKDNLLSCYSGYDEIYKEIISSIKEILGLDEEEITKELGDNFIKDRIGLVNGFYSDR